MSRKRPRAHSEKRKRQAVIAFRVTPDQRTQLQQLADQHGVSLGEYVRSKVLVA